MGLFGLFGKKKEKPVPEENIHEPDEPVAEEVFRLMTEQGSKYHFPEKGEEPDMLIECWVNLTEKNVKVDVPEEGLNIKNVYMWEDEKTIRGLVGDKEIFEVTSRSKAFSELKPAGRHKAYSVLFLQRSGDYGKYYRVRFRFEVVRG